jgi:hypothetical protein
LAQTEWNRGYTVSVACVLQRFFISYFQIGDKGET